NMTKTIQNIKNEDNKCFYYCIFAYLYNLEKSQAKDEDNEDNKTPRRYGDMKHLSPYINKNKDKVKFDNIEFPFEFNDDIFRMFEDMNPLIALKVLYFHHEDENDTVGNVHLSYINDDIYDKRPHQIKLLYIDPLNNPAVTDKERMNGHFCLIRDEVSLMTKLNSKHKEKLCYHEKCDQYFSSQKAFANHIKICTGEKVTLVTMPKENSKLSFDSQAKFQVRCPLIVYADFETMNTKYLVNPGDKIKYL
ncbi:MAG: hypothetical protein ACK559_19395, partial [bacterium]